MSDVQQRIHETVTTNPVVLYMKGDARFPQCGFSATAVQVLKLCGVTDFVTVNFRQLFNYDDGLYSHGGTQDMDIDAIGGSFDLDALDTVQMDRARVVQVDSDLEGRGSNMALIIFFESDFVRPVTLQGLLVYFSRTGLYRAKGGPST